MGFLYKFFLRFRHTAIWFSILKLNFCLSDIIFRLVFNVSNATKNAVLDVDNVYVHFIFVLLVLLVYTIRYFLNILFIFCRYWKLSNIDNTNNQPVTYFDIFCSTFSSIFKQNFWTEIPDLEICTQLLFILKQPE